MAKCCLLTVEVVSLLLAISLGCDLADATTSGSSILLYVIVFVAQAFGFDRSAT